MLNLGHELSQHVRLSATQDKGREKPTSARHRGDSRLRTRPVGRLSGSSSSSSSSIGGGFGGWAGQLKSRGEVWREDVWQHEAEEGEELRQPILDGRTGEQQLLACLDLPQPGVALGVLLTKGMRLVEHQQPHARLLSQPRSPRLDALSPSK